jgi:hypothetical protein
MRAFHSRGPGLFSRRQFLTYTAVGAGALSMGAMPSFASVTASSAHACSPPQFFLPRLAIESGPRGLGGYVASPDIWVVAVPDADAPPVTDLDFTRTYFMVARVRNGGSAPVFNAAVNFHQACYFCHPVKPFEAGNLLRTSVLTLDTQYVSIESRSDQRVLCPVAFSFFIEGTVLIVECFEPLTDPPAPPFGSLNFGSDRHVAARAL